MAKCKACIRHMEIIIEKSSDSIDKAHPGLDGLWFFPQNK